MKNILTVVAIASIVVLYGCRKTDPLNNPEYIGTWVSVHEDNMFASNYMIKIFESRDGYEQSDYSTFHSGECKIKGKKLLIGTRKHRIEREPYSIPTITLTETLAGDTILTSTKMRLCLEGAVLIGLRNSCGYVDFYKVE